jgi:hypothetical protein
VRHILRLGENKLAGGSRAVDAELHCNGVCGLEANDAKAIDALIEAQKLPPGPERTQALNKATRLRNAADTYGYLFSNELTAPK